jgi:hypothetical protein
MSGSKILTAEEIAEARKRFRGDGDVGEVHDSHEALRWEYENVCKFANDYEVQRDQARAEAAMCRAALEWYAKTKFEGDDHPDPTYRVGHVAREALSAPSPALDAIREAQRVLSRASEYIGDGDNGPPPFLNDTFEEINAALAALSAQFGEAK